MIMISIPIPFLYWGLLDAWYFPSTSSLVHTKPWGWYYHLRIKWGHRFKEGKSLARGHTAARGSNPGCLVLHAWSFYRPHSLISFHLGREGANCFMGIARSKTWVRALPILYTIWKGTSAHFKVRWPLTLWHHKAFGWNITITWLASETAWKGIHGGQSCDLQLRFSSIAMVDTADALPRYPVLGRYRQNNGLPEMSMS